MAADKIIVISTHILEEVDAVCNRAIIIADGRILADDTPQALESRSRYHNAVTLRFEKNAEIAGIRRHVEALNEVASVESSDKELRLTAFPKQGYLVLPAVSALAAREAWPLKELHLESGRLDEVFRTITGSTRGQTVETSHA
jgi:ABC-2 type transport system ATP-binding protein